MAVNPRVFFDLSISSQPPSRVVFELFKTSVPKTVENFRALCTGEKGLSPLSHLPLHYKSTPIHRVIEGFMIQGGDFTKRNGTGGESIYGGVFPDERLKGPGTEVDREGLLVMANRGADTNGSQFFVTLGKAEHLTGKHVVFGRVVSGMDTIQAIGKVETDGKDRPISPVMIVHCGELELRKPRPAAPPSPARSASPRRRSPSPRRRRYTSESDPEDERERRRRRERKREKREKRERRDKGEKRGTEREETLDELDARLEREEKERLEKERITEEEKRKRFVEESRRQAQMSDGVVFKGRGAMRYLDPEAIAAKRIPTNYNARLPDIRPRRYGPRGENEKWERGGRPNFDRAEDRDLDRYQVKRRDRDGSDNAQPERDEGDLAGRDRRKRDWDDWRVGRGREYGREERFERGKIDDGLDYAGDGGVSAGGEGKAGGLMARIGARVIDGEQGGEESAGDKVVSRPRSRSRSRTRSRSRSPVMRDSPRRGGSGESDMELDADD